jgi:hypothetical protein
VRNGAEKDAAMYWPLITSLNAKNQSVSALRVLPRSGTSATRYRG